MGDSEAEEAVSAAEAREGLEAEVDAALEAEAEVDNSAEGVDRRAVILGAETLGAVTGPSEVELAAKDPSVEAATGADLVEDVLANSVVESTVPPSAVHRHSTTILAGPAGGPFRLTLAA